MGRCETRNACFLLIYKDVKLFLTGSTQFRVDKCGDPQNLNSTLICSLPYIVQVSRLVLALASSESATKQSSSILRCKYCKPTSDVENTSDRWQHVSIDCDWLYSLQLTLTFENVFVHWSNLSTFVKPPMCFKISNQRF